MNMTTPRLNLLFSMADQLRFDALSSVTPSLHTPNLDQLASEGVRFSKAYSSTPTCTPARAALLTGRSPWNHGMLGYGVIAKEYPFEFPRALAAAGYETFAIGKDHFGWDEAMGASGFGPFNHSYKKWRVYDATIRCSPPNSSPSASPAPLSGHSFGGTTLNAPGAIHELKWHRS